MEEQGDPTIRSLSTNHGGNDPVGDDDAAAACFKYTTHTTAW
jgi:hypothetical protein